MSEDLEDDRDLPESAAKYGDPDGEHLDPSETMRKIPPPDRISTEQFFGAAMSVGNPLHQKITSDHISEIISLKRETTHQGYSDRREARRILAVIAVVFLLVVVGFAVLLVIREQNELMLELLKALGLFLGGFGVGWGLQSFRQRNS